MGGTAFGAAAVGCTAFGAAEFAAVRCTVFNLFGLGAAFEASPRLIAWLSLSCATPGSARQSTDPVATDARGVTPSSDSSRLRFRLRFRLPGRLRLWLPRLRLRFRLPRRLRPVRLGPFAVRLEADPRVGLRLRDFAAARSNAVFCATIMSIICACCSCCAFMACCSCCAVIWNRICICIIIVCCACCICCCIAIWCWKYWFCRCCCMNCIISHCLFVASRYARLWRSSSILSSRSASNLSCL